MAESIWIERARGIAIKHTGRSNPMFGTCNCVVGHVNVFKPSEGWSMLRVDDGGWIATQDVSPICRLEIYLAVARKSDCTVSLTGLFGSDSAIPGSFIRGLDRICFTNRGFAPAEYYLNKSSVIENMVNGIKRPRN